MGCRCTKALVVESIGKKHHGDSTSNRNNRRPSVTAGVRLPQDRSTINEYMVNLNLKKKVREVYSGFKDGDMLGTGNWGTVRAVTRIDDGKKFACKILRLSNHMSEGKMEELRTEINILAKMDHPYIAKLYEVYEDAGLHLYLILELLQGGELYTKLTKHSASGHYTEQATIKAVTQMVSAVAYLHERDIVHRDLKLENWVYRDSEASDSLVLIDFGLSKKYHQHHHHHSSEHSTLRVDSGEERYKEIKDKGNKNSGGLDDEGEDEEGEEEEEDSEGEPIEFHDVVGSSYYIAPEVLEGSYGMECDMWSLGVIVFMLLSGRPPFGGEDETEIMKRALIGVYSMHHHVWDDVSEEAKDFVRKLLQKDPAVRMTSAQALKHPWLQLQGRHNVKLDPSIMRNLRRFTRVNEFKRLAMQAVVFSLGRDEVSELEKTFEAMDEDNDGYVSLEEFRKAMSAQGLMNKNEQDKMFNAMDMDHLGKGIHLNEFLAAAVSEAQFGSELNLLHAFERLDIHHTGKIRVGDLREMLGEEHSQKEVSAMISDFVRDAHRNENRNTTPNSSDTDNNNRNEGSEGRCGGGEEGRASQYAGLTLDTQSASSSRRISVDDAVEVTYTDFLRAMRAGVPSTPRMMLSPKRRSSKRRIKLESDTYNLDSAGIVGRAGGEGDCGGHTPRGASPRHCGAMLPPSIYASLGPTAAATTIILQDPPPQVRKKSGGVVVVVGGENVQKANREEMQKQQGRQDGGSGGSTSTGTSSDTNIANVRVARGRQYSRRHEHRSNSSSRSRSNSYHRKSSETRKSASPSSVNAAAAATTAPRNSAKRNDKLAREA